MLFIFITKKKDGIFFKKIILVLDIIINLLTYLYLKMASFAYEKVLWEEGGLIIDFRGKKTPMELASFIDKKHTLSCFRGSNLCPLRMAEAAGVTREVWTCLQENTLHVCTEGSCKNHLEQTKDRREKLWKHFEEYKCQDCALSEYQCEECSSDKPPKLYGNLYFSEEDYIEQQENKEREVMKSRTLTWLADPKYKEWLLENLSNV
jgi:hypothetical protein